MHNVQSPRTDEGAIEQEIQAKGLTAPRVTPADIEAAIASEHFFTAADGCIGSQNQPAEWRESDFPLPLSLLTFCVLVMRNGFTVVGTNACVSPENFNAEIGRKIARENAVREIWPLLGYELKSRLAQPVLTDADAAADLAGTPRPGRVFTVQPQPESKLDEMKHYVGTKRIRAMPMTRKAYNDLRGWEVPADENGADDGFLVEYIDGGKPNVAGYAGYVSWSPKDVFERAYRPLQVEVRSRVCGVDCHPGDAACNGYCTGSTSSPECYWRELMDFGLALQALKAGKKVARKGWNGKGMWLSLSGPLEGRTIPAELFWSKNNWEWVKKQPDGHAVVLPCITMKTINADGREAILMGWLASQTDMLSEDWVVVE